jgi:hypothetical protein
VSAPGLKAAPGVFLACYSVMSYICGNQSFVAMKKYTTKKSKPKKAKPKKKRTPQPKSQS